MCLSLDWMLSSSVSRCCDRVTFLGVKEGQRALIKLRSAVAGTGALADSEAGFKAAAHRRLVDGALDDQSKASGALKQQRWVHA